MDGFVHCHQDKYKMQWYAGITDAYVSSKYMIMHYIIQLEE